MRILNMNMYKKLVFKLLLLSAIGFNAIAFSMYGFFKLSGIQLTRPTHIIMRQLSEFNPTNFMWGFHAISPYYAFVVGLSQMVSAFLIIIPHTRKFGLLFYLYNVAQIFLINYCFDITIQVKILSTVLLLNTIVLFYVYRKSFLKLLKSNCNDETFSTLKKCILNSLIFLNTATLFFFGIIKLFGINIKYINERFHYQPNLMLKDLVPSDLMWIFYTISRPYEIIVGLILMALGLLLSISSTSKLVLLLYLFVISQIVMINFFFDLSSITKILSVILLLSSCYLTFLNLSYYKQLFIKGIEN